MRKLSSLSILALLLSSAACDLSGTGTIGDGDGDGDGDGTGDGDGDGDVDDPCFQVEPISTEAGEPADLLMVVDKSGSMDDPLATGERKWPTMRSALDTVVNEYDDGIRFGLSLYPTGQDCDPGQVVSDIELNNAGAISSRLSSTGPDGGTPTHTTIAAAQSYYASIPANPNGQYVLLATDGEPNCGDPNDPQTPTVNESISAITSLASAGVPTFVLGFGGAVNNYPDTLKAMAQAGGTGDYFAANSPQQLQTALDAIAAELGVVSCSLRLDNAPTNPDLMTVSQNGNPVDQDPSNGWTYDAGTNSITFHGAACDAMKDGAVSEVSVDLACGTPPVD